METMTVAKQTLSTVDLSWGTQSMMWKDQEGTVHNHVYDAQCFSVAPDLPFQELMLGRLYLPMEWLLVRHVSLPLKQANMVDAEMLFQELADSSDIDANDWWLTWRLQTCEEGIAGMVFGLPESLRSSMQDNEPWSKTKEVLVDGYERLQQFVHGDTACLILDQDADGLFLGMHDGQVWRGMRRINGSINPASYQELLCSVFVMGFDKKECAIRGHIGQDLSDMLQADELLWQGDVINELASRHAANIDMLDTVIPSLNIRHGRWSLRQGWSFLKVWKRSMMLCALLLVAWLFGTVIDIYRLDDQLKVAESRIEAAFHQGLPHEPVMLDALAQLKKAAGGGSATNPLFLSSLQAVSHAYQSKPWQLKSLELRDNDMYMAGEISDIKALNHIQSMLKSELNRNINIVDTNMSGKKITFRMQW